MRLLLSSLRNEALKRLLRDPKHPETRPSASAEIIGFFMDELETLRMRCAGSFRLLPA